MAKKSSKSTRRTRAKKQEASKKKPVAAIEAETASKHQKTSVEEKTADSVKTEIADEAEKQDPIASVEDMIRPQRRRMIASAIALGIVIIALVIGAAAIRQGNMGAADTMAESGQVSGEADKILQSGGSVCTNGATQANNAGSASPSSVGMMLQSVPTNDIQTPQTISGSNDASTLQGAACY